MINGDNKLGLWKKFLYFPQCIFFSMKGKENKATIMNVKLKKNDNFLDVGTPSRKLSNLLWSSLNWNLLSTKIGSKLSLFDIGCGKGHYGFKYQKLIGEKFLSYTGIDIYKHKNFPEQFNHILDKAENSYKYVENHNCIVSQSALEHIEKDIQTLSKLTEVLIRKNKPFIQVHLVPASAALYLYLWHGWRQYSKKNLGNISELLASSYDVNVRIVPLGGWRCFIAHLNKITIPNLLRRTFKLKSNYDWEIENSNTTKLINENVLLELNVNEKMPTFWALIIASKQIDINSIFL